MSGGGAGGKGAAAPVPAGSRKLVQSLKEIVNRPEAEIYAALRECGMDPDEAVSRLLSQDTFQEVKSKRDKKKEIKEVPEPRSRSNTSTSRGVRGGADRGGRSNSVHSSSTDNVPPRPPVSGPGAASSNSSQKQTVASGSSANKHVVADGPAVSSQPSSGFQHGWSGTPGQLSMADIVKMGRPPQGKASSKPVVTADRGYAGQYPSLPSTVNQNLKQSGSTAPPTDLDKGLPLQDSAQVKNHGHSSAESKHTYEGDWCLQDEPTSANQLSLPETSGDPSFYETSIQSSALVTDVVNSHENSHFDENSTIAMRPASASERHLEHSEGVSEYNDGVSYQPQNYTHEVEDSSANVSAAAAANFQSLSLHNEELVAKKIAEDNPAVIIPDHLQVTNTECISLSFGSFGSGAFSGLLPQKTTDSNVELPVREESAPVDQLDARNQDYYESGVVNSSADENLEAMMGANMENIDAPSVSQANEHRTEVLNPPGVQYDMPSVSNHAYSNTNTSQPNTMEDPQGNNQAHTLSHLTNLMQANPLSTSSLLGSNQNHAALHGLEFDLPPYLEAKYNTGSTTNPRPAISMQEALKTGVFSNSQSTQSLSSSSIPTGPPLPQQLAAHHYSQPTLPLTHFANIVGYPTYLPQNYATYLSSGAFQQAYPSNGPFHQSAAALLGSGMKYSTPEYKNNLSATGLQQQQQPPQQQPPSSVISGYGGFGNSSNLPGNFALNQSTGSASTLGFDEALSRQYKDTSQYMALQQGDNSAMWLHGSGSRGTSALPQGHFYGFQGQSQLGGFRQAQQPQPSQFGGHGYPTFYQSQGGLTQEHPQNLAEGSSLNGFPAAPSQQSHPSWQHQHTY